MYKKAYHRLILPDGTIVASPVVTYDENGRVISWHTLQQEEPSTLWVGGTLDLSKEL